MFCIDLLAIPVFGNISLMNFFRLLWWRHASVVGIEFFVVHAHKFKFSMVTADQYVNNVGCMVVKFAEVYVFSSHGIRLHVLSYNYACDMSSYVLSA